GAAAARPAGAGGAAHTYRGLHAFADRAEVETVLDRLAAREAPLVRQLERRPGQQDARWVHLLGEVAAVEQSAPIGVVDRESVLRDGEEARTERVRRTFDAVAEPYAAALADELDDLPFERW